MSVNYTIPSRAIPVTDKNGIVDLSWYQFFKGLVPGKMTPQVTVTVTTSPFAYTCTDDGFVIIVGGTISAVTLTRTSVPKAIQTSGAIPVGRGDILTVTYSVAPTMFIYPTC